MGAVTSKPPTEPPRWQRLRTLLLVAALLRLVGLAAAWDAPPYSDEIAFHTLAANLAAGHGFALQDEPPYRPTSYRPPLWPGLLSLVYRVTGPSPAAARTVQVVLGVLLVALVYALAGLVDPAPRVRTFAGWWAALSPTLIFHSHALFSETLFGLCLGGALGLLLLTVRGPNRRAVLGAGLLLGLATLCRGSTLVFVPPALLWLVFAADDGWRPALRRALAIGGICAAVILPWTVRNTLVQAGPILVDSNGAVNFFFGNNLLTPRLRPWEAVELDPLPWPETSPGSTEVELQRQALREAGLYIAAHPGIFVTGLLIKSGNLWGLARDFPSGVAAGLYGEAPGVMIYLAAGISALAGLALLLLGVAGLALSPARRAAELQVLLMLALTLVHAVSYGHSRYRFGALLLLFGFAAHALSRRRTWREDWLALPASRRVPAAVLLVLLALNFLYEVIVLELIVR